MSQDFTRRRVVSLLSSAAVWTSGSREAAAQKSQPLPAASEFVRFADPTTETAVVRLTHPAWHHLLPSAGNRFVSLKPRALYCSSDRAGGRFQPFRVDLQSGAIWQVAETASLDSNSLMLDPAGRYLYFLDGGRLNEVPVGTRHERRRAEVLTENISTFSLGASRGEIFAITDGRLIRFEATERRPTVLADNAGGPCLARPARSGCLFTRPVSESEREFWYTEPGVQPTRLARGCISNPCWSSDGESVLFLRSVPQGQAAVAELREVGPRRDGERDVSATSQFAVFAANLNDSVFVGASSSRAQPNVVLLLRANRREMTLCEHRSSRPADVRPAFSPDSRRVYFQSDREGKSAVYSVNVEQLIEPT